MICTLACKFEKTSFSEKNVLNFTYHVGKKKTCDDPVHRNSDLIFYKTISLRTSAVSSTNFGSILIFASCVVGTCHILYTRASLAEEKMNIQWKGGKEAQMAQLAT